MLSSLLFLFFVIGLRSVSAFTGSFCKHLRSSRAGFFPCLSLLGPHMTATWAQ